MCNDDKMKQEERVSVDVIFLLIIGFLGMIVVIVGFIRIMFNRLNRSHQELKKEIEQLKREKNHNV